MNRHETVLRRNDALLLVIDYQEKLVGAMHNHETVTADIVRLMQGMALLQVPMIVTEQYPKGLGPTIDELTHEFGGETPLEKMTFSCCGNDGFWNRLKKTGRKQIVAVGIETHVCVLQTVLDLLANGYQVHIPKTAVSSRAHENRDNALQRMNQAGAIITNVESVLFELLVEAGTDDFKKVRKLIV